MECSKANELSGCAQCLKPLVRINKASDGKAAGR